MTAEIVHSPHRSTAMLEPTERAHCDVSVTPRLRGRSRGRPSPRQPTPIPLRLRTSTESDANAISELGPPTLRGARVQPTPATLTPERGKRLASQGQAAHRVRRRDAARAENVRRCGEPLSAAVRKETRDGEPRPVHSNEAIHSSSNNNSTMQAGQERLRQKRVAAAQHLEASWAPAPLTAELPWNITAHSPRPKSSSLVGHVTVSIPKPPYVTPRPDVLKVPRGSVLRTLKP